MPFARKACLSQACQVWTAKSAFVHGKLTTWQLVRITILAAARRSSGRTDDVSSIRLIARARAPVTEHPDTITSYQASALRTGAFIAPIIALGVQSNAA